MNKFGFEMILYLNDKETINISPPNSLLALTEITMSKFNLTKAELSFLDYDDDVVLIQSEKDYFNLFNYVEDNELSEIIIYVNSKEKIKKKKQSRKNSRSNKPNTKPLENKINKQVSNLNNKLNNMNINENFENDDHTLNDIWEAEDYKDLRNLKANDMLEEGHKYSKHAYSKKNLSRIYYIKEKKETLKEEQKNRESEKSKKKQEEINIENNKVDENFGKKNKNRKGNKIK